jgi:peptidoglycan-associated lipoprotein
LLPQAQDLLSKKAGYMLAMSGTSITIEGNCDERGTDAYNMALGERRAEAAKAYLVNLGVNPSQINTISYGEERPADPAHNEAAWAKNRRDHFVINN